RRSTPAPAPRWRPAWSSAWRRPTTSTAGAGCRSRTPARSPPTARARSPARARNSPSSAKETAMRLVLTIGTLLLMALSAGAQAPPIRIGFASAMSGPDAITGEGVKWGATLAVEEINAKGGVGGRKIGACSADNKAQPGEAVSAVRKLADVDQVDVIIGQTHSGACLGAMPVVKEIG